MFLCHQYKLQVKGHEDAGVTSTGAAAAGFLRREALMVLHHIFVVAFCFPASVVTMATQVDNNEGENDLTSCLNTEPQDSDI